jgi:hypothetical protein
MRIAPEHLRALAEDVPRTGRPKMGTLVLFDLLFCAVRATEAI